MRSALGSSLAAVVFGFLANLALDQLLGIDGAMRFVLAAMAAGLAGALVVALRARGGAR